MKKLEIQVIECAAGWNCETHVYGMTCYSAVRRDIQKAMADGEKFAAKLGMTPVFENGVDENDDS